MPLSYNFLEGSMTIDGIAMNNAFGAWGIIGDERGQGGYLPLWADFDVRGKDRILPTAVGVIAYPRRVTATRRDFRLIVVGDVDRLGAPNTDPIAGLQANLEYLRTNVIAPVATTTGTRAAVLTMPSTATRSADIHVLGVVTQSYNLASCGAIWIGTLQISIPSGRFT